MNDEQGRGGEHQQYLTFRLGDENFALPILAVKEILEYPSLTNVPLMASCVRGVLNLRGRVVPVVDLAVRFGRKPSPQTRRSCVVIIEVRSDEEWIDIGIVVDAVNQVIDIPATEIEPPPSFGARLRMDFIHGMGKLDGGFVVILDAAQVLSVEEIARLGGDLTADGVRAA
ncbi:MAG: chemotaxis protein CheW [Gammaproteobacteria bacterium]